MESIVLRPWQREDAQALALIANNRNIWNYVRDRFPSPYTVMDALQWIAHVNEQRPMVNFAIVYNGEIAGSIGCVPQEDVARKTVEIGYFIGAPYQGKGIATEAIHQLLDFIQTRMDVVRVFARVFEGNTASMHALRKNGFNLESVQRKAVIKNNSILDDYIWVKLN